MASSSISAAMARVASAKFAEHAAFRNACYGGLAEEVEYQAAVDELLEAEKVLHQAEALFRTTLAGAAAEATAAGIDALSRTGIGFAPRMIHAGALGRTAVADTIGRAALDDLGEKMDRVIATLPTGMPPEPYVPRRGGGGTAAPYVAAGSGGGAAAPYVAVGSGGEGMPDLSPTAKAPSPALSPEVLKPPTPVVPPSAPRATVAPSDLEIVGTLQGSFATCMRLSQEFASLYETKGSTYGTRPIDLARGKALLDTLKQHSSWLAQWDEALRKRSGAEEFYRFKCEYFYYEAINKTAQDRLEGTAMRSGKESGALFFEFQRILSTIG